MASASIYPNNSVSGFFGRLPVEGTKIRKSFTISMIAFIQITLGCGGGATGRGGGILLAWTRPYRGGQDSLPRRRRPSIGTDPHDRDRVAAML